MRKRGSKGARGEGGKAEDGRTGVREGGTKGRASHPSFITTATIIVTIFKYGSVIMSAESRMPRPARSSAWGPAMTASSAPGVSRLGQENPTNQRCSQKTVKTPRFLQKMRSHYPKLEEQGGLGLVVASKDADHAIFLGCRHLSPLLTLTCQHSPTPN